MPKEVLYLKLEQNAELSGESVHISDLGKLYCKTQSVQNRCRTLPVFRFEEKDKGRRVVSALLAGVQNRLCLLYLLFWRSVYDHGVS